MGACCNRTVQIGEDWKKVRWNIIVDFPCQDLLSKILFSSLCLQRVSALIGACMDHSQGLNGSGSEVKIHPGLDSKASQTDSYQEFDQI